jgi:hypothetical protein
LELVKRLGVRDENGKNSSNFDHWHIDTIEKLLPDEAEAPSLPT